MEWYIDEFLRRWEEQSLLSLEFIGFYWVRESIQKGVDEEVLRQTGEMIRKRGYSFFWIPYFRAVGYESWHELGFDAAMLQLNYVFHAYLSQERLAQFDRDGRRHGMGIEIESDGYLLTSQSARERYLDYLRGGVTYGYGGDVLRAHYQVTNLLGQMSLHPNPEVRYIYDATYQFVRGNWGEGLGVVSREESK